jgi:WD40 repeat protein
MNTRLNPYVGPRAFQPGEPFYGRDRELRSLSALLIAERIVLLHSPSGSGKTSLIQAGLLPRLRDENFNVLPIIRVNAEPPEGVASIPGFNRYALSTMLSLEEDLPEGKRTPIKELAALTLNNYLKKRPRADDTQDSDVLIFDQFEEVLTIAPTDRESKQAFFEQLGTALRNRNRWALVAIREDYLGALAPFVRPIPGRLTATFRLDLIGVDGAMQAIQKPAQSQKVDFAASAAQRLVDDLRRIQVQHPDGTIEEQLGPHVEPVQLQVVCYRLWQGLSDTDAKIDEKNLAGVGDVNRSLADYYSASVKSVSGKSGTSERIIREWFDRKLITPDGIRGQALMGVENSEGLPNAVVAMIEDAHIIRGEKRAGKTWFELSHDRMIKPVRDDNTAWFAANLSLFQQQAVLWSQQGRPDGMLLRGKQLDEAEKESKTFLLNDDEKAFLESCRKLRATERREKLRTRIIQGLAVGALIAMIVAVIFGIRASASEQQAQEALVLAQQAESTAVAARDAADAARADAVTQRDLADLNAKVAFSRELASSSIANLDVDPERSLLLALQAVDITQNAGQPVQSEIEDALRRAVQTSRVRLTISGHTGPIWGISFSPDGRLLATAGADKTMKVWDISKQGTESFSGQPLFTLSDFASDVASAAFSPDGTRLVTASYDNTAIVWEATTGKKLLTLEGHTGGINEAVFSPDGRSIVTASVDNTAKVWDAKTGRLKFDLIGHTGGLTSVAVSPDGTRIATASYDGTVIIWDARTGARLSTLGQGCNMLDVAFSPDGESIATADNCLLASVWDLASGETKFSKRDHTDIVLSVAFSPDGTLMASSSLDGTVIVRDANDGSQKYILRGDTSDINTIAFSPDGRMIATGNSDGKAKLWAASPVYGYEITGIQSATIDNTEGSPFFSADGSLIAYSGWSGSAEIWSPASGGNPMQVAQLPNGRVSRVAFSSDGKKLVISVEDYYDDTAGDAMIINAISGKQEKLLTSVSATVNCVAFSPDGKLVAGGTYGDSIIIWDEASGKIIKTLKSDQWEGYTDLAFSPDGTHLIAGTQTGRTLVWDIATSKRIGILENADRVYGVAYSPDGTRIASASYDQTAVIWDATSFKKVLTLTGHSAPIFHVAFSRDGSLIGTASLDGTVKLWDANTGNNILTINALAGPMSGIDFSPDGKTFVTGSKSGQIRLYYLHVEDVIALAKTFATRSLTEQECITYLHLEKCQSTTTTAPSAQPTIVAPTPTSAPVVIAPTSTAQATPLRSGDGGVEVTLEITNRTTETLYLFWVDSDGVELAYGEIAPNTTFTQGTFANHAWRVRDQAGNVILEFIATGQTMQKFEIAADKTVTTPTP